jgi:uncharacterized protein
VTDALPSFRYHPNPLDTGSIMAHEVTCAGSGRARGFMYVGPVYSLHDLDDRLCPWCIADGTAADRFGAEFTDTGWPNVPSDVPPEVIDVVSRRTPGFTGWQQEHWLYHCGDGAAFLGVADRRDGVTAYLFRCRHCGQHIAYTDFA